MIDGIGGAFLFSNDAKKLADWYRNCLGLDAIPADTECSSIFKLFEHRDLTNPEIKHTMVWAILPADQNINNQPRTGKINYRVSNMADILGRLKKQGVTVEKTSEDVYGHFAWLKDPEGNQIELWEPAKE